MSDTYKNVTNKHSEESCRPFREILSLVGDKWSIILISLLENKTKRFSELQRDVSEISQRILSLSLRNLERNGLVSRRVESTVPPSVYYSLTPLGETLLVYVKEIINWTRINYKEIKKSQELFDQKR
ncbi:winged helix-turn-helix transcriptional regulator [Francisella frigiditurris]|uniref:HxlR-like helix-turn-helix family protein n=1 Tax=Francisella frigiditurris TaxID=1542390 RepID=A0A1J0KVM8_9GAMM|nr:helix-turn-helix domain-containing protein [Francisella frigiditurris]APC97759.1 hxlR-like helix-turn-helix family protein [Francisella frigiditurris]